MFSNYLSLIKQQNTRYPKYPKYHYSNKIKLNIDPLEQCIQLLRDPHTFVNTVETKEPIFNSVDDLIYLEFVNTTININGSLDTWKYYYVPISYLEKDFNGSSLKSQLNLPFLYEYYIGKYTGVNKLYPDCPYLYRYTRPSFFYFEDSVTSNLHPYSSNFIFTGVYSLDRKGQMLYEYIDYKQTHDFAEILYVSSIAPINFYISAEIAPSYQRDTSQLFNDEFVGLSPKTYKWQGSYPSLSFSGEETNKSFASVKWFVYTININNILLNQILLPYPPTNKQTDFVFVELGQRLGFNFPINNNVQNVEYNQASNNNKILIGNS